MFEGPTAYALADWRRRINDIYAGVRQADDPQQGWRDWQDARSALFRHHPMSPLAAAPRQRFKKIPVFPYDPELRFEVSLHAIAGKPVHVDLGNDRSLSYTTIARTEGLTAKLSGELCVYWINGYGGGLFIPFGDASNGTATYGGGRYIIDAIKGADLGLGDDNGLILDFIFPITRPAR